jgi:hypothetical protein
MIKPMFWEPATVIKTIPNISPQLANWDKSSALSQIRLKSYLRKIMDELLPDPIDKDPLFVHLDVDVQKQEHLLKHHDLGNYLTPLFGERLLDARLFFLVTARKYVGGGSQLLLGIAQPTRDNKLAAVGNHFEITTRGSVQSKQWKENLRNALAATNPIPLNTPGVEVQIAWTCSPKRNWVNLWKPTGDCMGPILGEQNPLRPFSPDDDRIVNLKFHCTLDNTLDNDVHIAMWWGAVEGY